MTSNEYIIFTFNSIFFLNPCVWRKYFSCFMSWRVEVKPAVISLGAKTIYLVVEML